MPKVRRSRGTPHQSSRRAVQGDRLVRNRLRKEELSPPGEIQWLVRFRLRRQYGCSDSLVFLYGQAIFVLARQEVTFPLSRASSLGARHLGAFLPGLRKSNCDRLLPILNLLAAASRAQFSALHFVHFLTNCLGRLRTVTAFRTLLLAAASGSPAASARGTLLLGSHSHPLPTDVMAPGPYVLAHRPLLRLWNNRRAAALCSSPPNPAGVNVRSC